MRLNRLAGWLRIGVIGLLVAPWGEAWATDCPEGYTARGKACVHPTATVGTATIEAGAVIGEGVTIEDGATIGVGASIKKNSIVGARATVGARAKLGPHTYVGPGATVKPNTRTGKGWVYEVPSEQTQTVAYRPRKRLGGGGSRSSLLRPAVSSRLASAGWPITHAEMWTAWCDTPTTGAYNPRGGRALSFTNGSTMEAGIQHRRVYTVCVDIGEDGSAHILPSPANRWPRAMTFQSIEILSRQKGSTPIAIEVDGTPAIQGAVALNVAEVAAAWRGVDTSAATTLTTSGDVEETLATVVDSTTRERLAELAAEAHTYRRHYSTTFSEGTVTVKAGPRGTSGTEVGIALDALAEKSKATQVDAAMELTALSARIKLQDDLSPSSIEALERSITAAATPDATNLQAVLDAGEAITSVQPITQTIQVEDVYNLSLFTGIGIVTGDARSGSYEVVEAEGSRTLQSDGNSYVDPELVLGATLFPGRKPRTYTGFDLGLSVALGAVSMDDEGLGLFRSLYFGPTIGWRDLALTPTLTIKRGVHLRDGSALGMTITDSATTVDHLTEDRFGLGFGLMLTLPVALVDGFRKQSTTNSDDGSDQ